MLDADQRFRAEGASLLDAMIEAGERRLRPILMTALATVAGTDSAVAGIGRRLADATAARDRRNRRDLGVPGAVAHRNAGRALLFESGCQTIAFYRLRVLLRKKRMRILVVEDEPRMAELLRQGLTEEGHAVVVSLDGREGLSFAENEPFDLLLLDVMLPGADGFSIVRRLRSHRNQTPILMLTARDAMRDIVEGLNLGADDYLTKPSPSGTYSPACTPWWQYAPQPVNLETGDLTLNQATREVRRGSRPITLTRTEFTILELLMRHAGRVLSRDTLIETVWGGDSDIESNTLDAFMRLLRAPKWKRPANQAAARHSSVGFSLRAESK